MNPPKESLCFFWDLQNCAVPSKSSPYDCVTRIRSAVLKGETTTEVSFNAYCDSKTLSQETRQEFSRARVTVRDVSSQKSAAADIVLLQDILRHAMTHRSGIIVLISGDIDFAETVHDLIHTGGYRVILIHNKQARPELRKNATKAISFEDVVRGEGGGGRDDAAKDIRKDDKAPKPTKSGEKKKDGERDQKPTKAPKGDKKKDTEKGQKPAKFEPVHYSTIRTTTRAWNCGECGKSFQNEASMDQHKAATGHDEKITCQECEKTFGDINSLAQHLEATQHCKKTAWPCPRCKNESWKSLKKLLAHLQELDENPSGADGGNNGNSREHRANCDVCSKTIMGVRYKCLDCPDYDECSKCRGNGMLHAEGHSFYALKDPSATVPDDVLKKHQRPKDGTQEYFDRWAGQCRRDPIALQNYQMAVAGHQNAEYWVATCFATGVFGSAKDGLRARQYEALQWGLKAARQGHAEAQWLVGLQYYKGEGTAKNLVEAEKWFGAAAKQGHSRARDAVDGIRRILCAESMRSL